MPTISIDLDESIGPELYERVARRLLPVLVAHNLEYLRANPGRFPPLLESAVRYRRELPGRERWEDLPTLYRQGYGDCEDLACALAAELQAKGQPAEASMIKGIARDGRPAYHVLVKVNEGRESRVIDPSILLGATAP